MERDGKDDGGLVAGEEEEGKRSWSVCVWWWWGEAGDEMRQRLRAEFKPTMSRVDGMYKGASSH